MGTVFTILTMINKKCIQNRMDMEFYISTLSNLSMEIFSEKKNTWSWQQLPSLTNRALQMRTVKGSIHGKFRRKSLNSICAAD